VGIGSKLASSYVLFILTPWYQCLRALGLGAAAAAVGAGLLIVPMLVAVGVRHHRGALSQSRPVVFLTLGSLVSLVPFTMLGANTCLPTLAGRYLYVAWALWCIALGTTAALHLRPPRRQWLAACAFGVAYILPSVALVGTAESTYLQRSSTDRRLIQSVIDAEATGRSVRRVLVVAEGSPTAGATLPTPSPAELESFSAGDVQAMLRTHGVAVEVEVAATAPEGRKRPGDVIVRVDTRSVNAGR